MSRLLATAAAIAVSTFVLTGCIDSKDPILADSQPVLGDRLQFSLYSLRDGKLHDDGEKALFNWNGRLYHHTGGALDDLTGFSVHPFEDGHFIIQTFPWDHARGHEYALMHPVPLADGAYVVVAIDEADADAATRQENCQTSSQFSCRVSTREQLFALARATAVHPHASGGLAVRFVRETPQKKKRP